MDYSYDYSYTATGAEEGILAGVLAMLAGVWFIALAVAIVMVVALWKIFVKAGKPGWASLIPIYNLIVLLEIVGRPTWWVALYLLAIIPFIGSIAVMIVQVIITLDLAKKFGKDTVFAILMIFFPYVMYPILAFGDAKYQGAAAPAKVEEAK